MNFEKKNIMTTVCVCEEPEIKCYEKQAGKKARREEEVPLLRQREREIE